MSKRFRDGDGEDDPRRPKRIAPPPFSVTREETPSLASFPLELQTPLLRELAFSPGPDDHLTATRRRLMTMRSEMGGTNWATPLFDQWIDSTRSYSDELGAPCDAAVIRGGERMTNPRSWCRWPTDSLRRLFLPLGEGWLQPQYLWQVLPRAWHSDELASEDSARALLLEDTAPQIRVVVTNNTNPLVLGNPHAFPLNDPVYAFSCPCSVIHFPLVSSRVNTMQFLDEGTLPERVVRLNTSALHLTVGDLYSAAEDFYSQPWTQEDHAIFERGTFVLHHTSYQPNQTRAGFLIGDLIRNKSDGTFGWEAWDGVGLRTWLSAWRTTDGVTHWRFHFRALRGPGTDMSSDQLMLLKVMRVDWQVPVPIRATVGFAGGRGSSLGQVPDSSWNVRLNFEQLSPQELQIEATFFAPSAMAFFYRYGMNLDTPERHERGTTSCLVLAEMLSLNQPQLELMRSPFELNDRVQVPRRVTLLAANPPHIAGTDMATIPEQNLDALLAAGNYWPLYYAFVRMGRTQQLKQIFAIRAENLSAQASRTTQIPWFILGLQG